MSTGLVTAAYTWEAACDPQGCHTDTSALFLVSLLDSWFWGNAGSHNTRSWGQVLPHQVLTCQAHNRVTLGADPPAPVEPAGDSASSDALTSASWKTLSQNHLVKRFLNSWLTKRVQFSSVQFSRVRLFAIPWTAARQASLSITNSWSSPKPMPLSHRCHPNISSSAVPFSFCPQSFPASGSFPMSQLFASGGLSIGVSASTSVLPMNTQDWSPLEWTGWISLQSKGLSRKMVWDYKYLLF